MFFLPPEQTQGWEGGSKFSSGSLRAAMLPDSSSYIECGSHVTSETSVCFVKLLLYLQFNMKLCFKKLLTSKNSEFLQLTSAIKLCRTSTKACL